MISRLASDALSHSSLSASILLTLVCTVFPYHLRPYRQSERAEALQMSTASPHKRAMSIAQPQSPTVSDHASDHSLVPTLLDFVNTVPPPLTAVLTGLSPTITPFRCTLEILSWQAPWSESWLVVAAWWGVCLLSNFGLRCVRLRVKLNVSLTDMDTHADICSP